MEIVELVVSDDELDVGDNEVASSDIIEGGKLAGNPRGRKSGYPAPVFRG